MSETCHDYQAVACNSSLGRIDRSAPAHTAQVCAVGGMILEITKAPVRFICDSERAIRRRGSDTQPAGCLVPNQLRCTGKCAVVVENYLLVRPHGGGRRIGRAVNLVAVRRTPLACVQSPDAGIARAPKADTLPVVTVA